jgi:hypothetical protein
MLRPDKKLVPVTIAPTKKDLFAPGYFGGLERSRAFGTCGRAATSPRATVLNSIVQLPVRNRDLIVALDGFPPRRSCQNLANFIVRLDRFFTV